MDNGKNNGLTDKKTNSDDISDYSLSDDYAEEFGFVEIEVKKPISVEKKKQQKPKQSKETKDKQSKLKDKFFVARMFLMTFALSIVFSVITEVVLSGGNLVVSLLLLLTLILINILFDIIGTSAASCDIQPFISKASRKDKMAVKAVSLLKNAEKVSSFCNDVVGDISGIVSGGCAGAIVLAIASQSGTTQIVLNVVFSGIISAMTVGGKAFGKLIAIRQSERIISMVAKAMTFFKK